MSNQNRVLRIKDLCLKLGVSRSCVYHWISQGFFPAPIHLSPFPRGAVGWNSADVDQWLEARRNKLAGGQS